MYSLIIRTLTILEGLALYVDPDFRLVRGAYPFIGRYNNLIWDVSVHPHLNTPFAYGMHTIRNYPAYVLPHSQADTNVIVS